MIYDLQTTDDPRDIVHRSVQALVEGQVIGVPSETVYGLVASSLCPAAVRRLAKWTAACRDWKVDGDADDEATIVAPAQESGAIALSVRSGDAVGDFLMPMTPLARRLSERCFPGPLTLIAQCDDAVSATSCLPEIVANVLRVGAGCESASGGGAVAFRVSEHRLLSHIHRYLSAPLVWAEIGRPDQSPPNTAEKLQSALAEGTGETLPLLLDDGISRYGDEGTVVRVTGNQWHVERTGVIQQAAMNQFVKPVIALVCTGNTCRSPMAETLLREALRRKFGREDVARVVSAGVAAGHGSGASPQAVQVMGKRGLDLTGHASQPLEESLMSMADLVLTMTRRHREAIVAAWPDRAERVFTLRRDGGDISDPVGMPVDVYEQCADQIVGELEGWLGQLPADFFPSDGPDEGPDDEPMPHNVGSE
ncbi:arsenate reductase/protein-tyrosine-phosphatase family protein [Rhodopirellula halodulae]|uniref:arsenate reductase/protein-tyrosine-phosphatase family protein n=1 Tax=Rhodopirellula halodulae TaxID=2894198 RepID=UPI001E363830|nr:Sua5/YciO/YrdC/YwlC family protein [Rhodopirellula sp. JC737]MCC9656113.1 Sua5/YciO/YrdC/YwlC family protein [Rhodopirellula sp. JC737]